MTVPPKNSIPSSTLPNTSMWLIVVSDPTPPNVRPFISLPSPISAPPWRIEMYCKEPELSSAIDPP